MTEEDRAQLGVERGSGTPVTELVVPSRTLSREEFEDRHGRAFLMLGHVDLATPDGPGSTVVEVEQTDEAPSGAPAFAPHLHPLRQTGRSVGPFVSIGRTSNNDVVIPDVSVSRFHAFVKEGGGGALCILDAGSTNGTHVNGRSVPVQGKGAAVALKSGDRVRIGQVDLTFMEAELLIRLLRG